MQSINKMQCVAAALVASSPAFAHEGTGWGSIHWHASDFLGLAVVGVLCIGAVLVARRKKRAAKKQDKQ